MKVTIVESVIGVFAFDEDNKLVEKTFYPKDSLKTAEKLQKIEAGKVVKEIEILVKKLHHICF
jgi:hypothetical protein